MVVLDENLKDNRIRIAIAQWYQGQVVFIRDLRPNTIIKDEAIPSLLQRVNEPTFVTINVGDFWIQTTPSSRFCIIAIEIPKERSLEIPELLRGILQLDAFKTKASRMGKVIRWTPTRIEYYEANQKIHIVSLE